MNNCQKTTINWTLWSQRYWLASFKNCTFLLRSVKYELDLYEPFFRVSALWRTVPGPVKKEVQNMDVRYSEEAQNLYTLRGLRNFLQSGMTETRWEYYNYIWSAGKACQRKFWVVGKRETRYKWRDMWEVILKCTWPLLMKMIKRLNTWKAWPISLDWSGLLRGIPSDGFIKESNRAYCSTRQVIEKSWKW